MQPSKTRATYQDVLDAPPDVVAELIDGDLYLQPRPRGIHQRIASELYSELRGPYDQGVSGPGGWVILQEVELRLPMTLVPDLSGWLRTRFQESLDSTYFETRPDWVCEVISPSNESYDRNLKKRMYHRSGVAHLWFVDPRTCLLEVHGWHQDGYLHLQSFEADEQVTRALPFPDASFALSMLWRT